MCVFRTHMLTTWARVGVKLNGNRAGFSTIPIVYTCIQYTLYILLMYDWLRTLKFNSQVHRRTGGR